MIFKVNKCLFLFFIIVVELSICLAQFQEHTDFLLCRFCGYNIAPATHVVNIPSPAAEDVSNQTLFGVENVEVQKIRNPLGVEFNIVTSSGSTCIGRPEQWKSKHSWFPGYSWKPCYCSHCPNQIGWIFEPISTAHEDRLYASRKGFYALILDNIISEDYSDSLLVAPKISSL